MVKISIDGYLKEIGNIALGCLVYNTSVTKDNKELWEYLESDIIPKIKDSYTLDTLSNNENIQASRQIYKKLGKDPSRYRVSSEALIRRILQGKGLYKINSVVDVNNLISIETGYSVGSYDLDKLNGNITFTIGKKGETYQGIGKDLINIENLPVFRDSISAYGSPTSDSTRAMIKDDTRMILTVLISFNGSAKLASDLEYATKCINKYENVDNIETMIIE